MKLQEDMITIRGNRAKWRKLERMLGTNHDDAVKMLEKYSESAGKCDNNKRKMVQKPSEMKETGKILGNIH